ncbi:Hint domain-containing protein [Defluviimonas sp. WL0050]|uniref:Hint domain-containing protein n=1 Tax=Albidovulum litorale TaxID=2984134 RepID=A0ABT2ZI84_9RHOB|nr:Hint domain-containing protein [Defluviimonas sp. WL0050]MCV2870738.1 Hint domain-containing protein [Defluviimonas sp. WL0050]
MPSFTPGTFIATPTGERAIEELRPGDRVITRDRGVQEVQWVGRRRFDHNELASAGHLGPILIEKGSLGKGLPERDVIVSPNQRLLVPGDRTVLRLEAHEALVAAKHLINNRTIRNVSSLGGAYIHAMCDRGTMLMANGCWMESFQPTDNNPNGLGNAQRNEILEIFPELAAKLTRRPGTFPSQTPRRSSRFLN